MWGYINLVFLLFIAVADLSPNATFSPTFWNFGTHTSYEAVRENIEPQEGCKAVKMWGFMRHGTRYPSAGDNAKLRNLQLLRDVILRNHKYSKGNLSNETLTSLSEWLWNVTDAKKMRLTTSGVAEIDGLAARLKNSFPELFSSNIPKNLEMKRTSADRTGQTAEAMYRALYGRNIPFMSLPAIDERLLRVEKSCKAWKTAYSSKVLKKQVRKLRTSELMETMREMLSMRLGFSDYLSDETIGLIYEACGYETAWYKRPSPWCSIFTTEELELLEYELDLENYWQSGFGNPYSKKLGCILVRNMMLTLNRSKGPTVYLNFAHEQGIKSLLVSLGISDCPNGLSATDYIENGKRTWTNCWKISKLVPFTANIISVLYNCSTVNKRDLKIGVYVNEKLIPFCGEGKLCNFKKFKEEFTPMIDASNCNKNFCREKATILSPEELN